MQNILRGIRTRTSSKGRYLRKLFAKIGLGLGLRLGLGLGFGDLSSETISEDTYLCWMSECEFHLKVVFHSKFPIFAIFLNTHKASPNTDHNYHLHVFKA